MKKYVIQKQFIGKDKNMIVPHWSLNEIWVVKLFQSDVIEQFDTLDEAINRKSELELLDNSRRYRIVEMLNDLNFTVIQ